MFDKCIIVAFLICADFQKDSLADVFNDKCCEWKWANNENDDDLKKKYQWG